MPVLWLLFAQVSLGCAAAQSRDVTFSSGAGSGSLVELYTSEGCSSCPPAEAWLGDLKKSPGLWTKIFPVNFHVDYWDGLGWPDRFAREAYTQRQRDDAARLKQDSVYTPEFIVDGAEFRGWFHGEPLPNPTVKGGDLKLAVREGRFSGSYVPTGGGSPRGLTLNIAILGMGLVTNVKAGENDGRQLKHDFIVLGFRSAPLVSGSTGGWEAGPMEIKSLAGDSPAAVVGWVSGSDGAILQMAGGWMQAGR